MAAFNTTKNDDLVREICRSHTRDRFKQDWSQYIERYWPGCYEDDDVPALFAAAYDTITDRLEKGGADGKHCRIVQVATRTLDRASFDTSKINANDLGAAFWPFIDFGEGFNRRMRESIGPFGFLYNQSRRPLEPLMDVAEAVVDYLTRIENTARRREVGGSGPHIMNQTNMDSNH